MTQQTQRQARVSAFAHDDAPRLFNDIGKVQQQTQNQETVNCVPISKRLFAAQALKTE